MDIDSTLLLYLLYLDTKQRSVLERNSITDRGPLQIAMHRLSKLRRK
jgi:hypothetical protein